ncbi:MAG TPA: hypothetical protein VH682_32755 [Gemmataceae bacterium]|jgi:hypothetical protein
MKTYQTRWLAWEPGGRHQWIVCVVTSRPIPVVEITPSCFFRVCLN